MGGKRIAEQVRRALIAAAKMGTVVVAIDSAGCEERDEIPVMCPYIAPDSGGFSGTGGSTGGAQTGGRGSGGLGVGGTCAAITGGRTGAGGRDASSDASVADVASDASTDASTAPTDAGKDGG